MKTHTVPIITNGTLCGEACPWLLRHDNEIACFSGCVLFQDDLNTCRIDGQYVHSERCNACRHVTERAEALP